MSAMGYSETPTFDNEEQCREHYSSDSMLAKLRGAVQINPWSFFDTVHQLVGTYVRTVGYVAEIDGDLYLMPSAEYSRYFLLQYAARLPVRTETICGEPDALADGDYIRIVGRVADCPRCERTTFDEVVFLRKLMVYPNKK